MAESKLVEAMLPEELLEVAEMWAEGQHIGVSDEGGNSAPALVGHAILRLARQLEQAERTLREVEPLLDAQFEGHLNTAEFMEKARKLNKALDLVRAALVRAGGEKAEEAGEA